MEELQNKPFLSPEEFRQILRCSRALCYEAIRQGKIRSFRLGRKIFIPSSEVSRLGREAGADKGEVPQADPDLW